MDCLAINDSPRQHNDQSSEQDNTIQAKPVVGCRKQNLREPLVRETWMARSAKGKDVSGGNAPGLQNQVSGQDMTRQVAIEIQDSGSAGNNSPKNCYQ